MSKDKKPSHILTKAVHGGESREKPEFSITTPIFPTSTYVFKDTQALFDFMEGKVEREEYGRYGNPTVKTVERKLAVLENAEDAVMVSSGMSAVIAVLMAFCSQGDHIVMTNDCYRRTRQFVNAIFSRFGVETTLVPPDTDAIEKAIQPNTKLLFSESPTNPYNHVLDLEKVAAICAEKRIRSVIDATFSTPFNQRPCEFGIDLVVHSATKYLGGHNDLLAGAVVGKRGLVGVVRDLVGVLGCITDPFTAYLLIRGLKTFPLRMAQQNQTALALAQWLEKHPRVQKVHYAGLESHSCYPVAIRQMDGFGAVISFELEGDGVGVSKFIDALKIPYIGPSLGGVESLVEQPSYMSYFELSTEERLKVGIKDNLVRYAVGVEGYEDLLADIKQAMDCLP